MSLDLDSLDALLAKATPGEWFTRESFGSSPIFAEGPCNVSIADAHSYENLALVAPNAETRKANAALVVALRNAAPALVAELRAAREALDRVRPVYPTPCALCGATWTMFFANPSIQMMAHVGNCYFALAAKVSP